MLKREYTEYHYKGQWDFEKRVGTRVGYDLRRCQQIAADVMACSRTGEPDVVLDLVHGLVSGRFPLQKVVTIENGEVTSSIDYSHESNLIVQLLAGSETGSYTAHFIYPVVYRSNFNQMYVLGRYDAELFTEVVERYPGARVFRLNASALTPE
jgi:dolichyl-diphosphooligosaccharide--protein glycosyltransferase